MDTPQFTPPPPEDIARLRARPSFKHPDQQAIIDRLANGEIGNEECLQLLLDDSLKRTTATQRQKQVEDEASAELERQQQQREQQAREMQQNEWQDEPTIISQLPGEAPATQGSVLSNGGKSDAALPGRTSGTTVVPLGIGGASGTWPAAVETQATAALISLEPTAAGTGAQNPEDFETEEERADDFED